MTPEVIDTPGEANYDQPDSEVTVRIFLVGLLLLGGLLACGEASAPGASPAATGGGGAGGGAGGASGAGAAGGEPGGAGAGGGGSSGQGGQAGPVWEVPCAFSAGLSGGGVACAIRPSDTRAEIADSFGYHAVGIPATWSSATPVYLHLVGSGGEPAKPTTQAFPNEEILAQVTSKGVFVLMVAYDNKEPIGSLCKTDLDCYEPIRRSVLFGDPVPPPHDALKSVAKPNDIVSRARELVSYLKSKSPSGGLPAAISGGDIEVGKLRVGGHSQGGGHAALLAKTFQVERLCMLSSPLDGKNTLGGAESVPWVAGSWATPAGSRRGTIHEKDDGFAKAQANLAAMGLSEGVHWRRLTGATPDPHSYTAKDSSAEPAEARSFCILDP